MIAKIEGQIVASGIKEIEKKKYIQLMVLQIQGADAEIIKVKDNAVENFSNYSSGSFSATCRVAPWNFGDRSGVSVSVISNNASKKSDKKSESKVL